jgi:AmmeMemoRadiSam system protein B
MSSNSIREASHAGSWYESDGNQLDQQLSTWLSEAAIDPTDIDRVFLLGPSHHYSLNNCALTNHAQYETPLYNIKIDTQISSELYKTGLFSIMNKQQDSDEHSLEMHLPYIAKVFEKYVI